MEKEQNGSLTLQNNELTIAVGQESVRVIVLGDGALQLQNGKHFRCECLDAALVGVSSDSAATSKVLVRQVTADSGHAAQYECMVNGKHILVTVDNRRSLLRSQILSSRSSSSHLQFIVAPMPGLVTKIEVAVGDSVVQGQGILILEAMKMENEIRASGPGVVKQIRASLGTPVEKGELLVEIEPLT